MRLVEELRLAGHYLYEMFGGITIHSQSART